MINAAGTSLVRLTDGSGDDGNPAWSRDGRRIAFQRRVLRHAQLFVMDADGSNPTRLTDVSAVLFNAFPSWGPVR